MLTGTAKMEIPVQWGYLGIVSQSAADSEFLAQRLEDRCRLRRGDPV